MSNDPAQLARTSLDRRFAQMKPEALTVPPYGWLRAIREALGMTPQKLAERMGVTRPRINTLEKAEVTGATTLRSLRDAAEAMDCVLVYAIIPRTSLDQTMRAQALTLANAELTRLDHTMRLENQALTEEDLTSARARLVTDLLAGPSRRLWERP